MSASRTNIIGLKVHCNACEKEFHESAVVFNVVIEMTWDAKNNSLNKCEQ